MRNHHNKRDHRFAFESLEPRALLSITDTDTSFGTHGIIAPPAALGSTATSYQLENGDTLEISSHETPATPTQPPIFTDPIAELSPTGQVLWTNTITDNDSDYPLDIGPVTQLADGSVVVGVLKSYGNSGTFYLYKFDSSGNPIPSFTTNYGSIPGGADAEGGINALLPLPNDSLLAFHVTDSGTFQVQPVAADGTPGTGWVTQSFPASDGQGFDLVPYLQPDGKLVITGTVGGPNNNTQLLAVERLDADGTADPTFGTDGTTVTTLVADPDGLQEDSQGDIDVMANGFNNSADVLRFTSTGQLDSSFANDGIYSALSRVYLDALQPASDGSMYAAGTRRNQTYLLHLSSNGSVSQAALGSSEPLAGGSSLNASITPSGELLVFAPSGLIQEDVGFSVSQPTGDATSPTISLGRLRRVPVNSPTYDISVIYTDTDSGVDTQTLETGNLILKVANHTIYGRLIAQNSLDNGQVAAEYSFAAPSGEWNQNDVGIYTIETAADEVTDNAGNGLPLEVLGSFTIKAEKSSKAAAVIQMDIPMLATVEATPDWLKSDGKFL